MDPISAFLIGYVAGIVTVYFIVRSAIRSLVKKLEQELLKDDEEQDVDPAIKTRVEMENGMFYVYEVDNGQFIAQGTTLAELKAHCSERFKNSRDIKIVSGQKEAIEQLKSQLKELNENSSSV